MNRIFQFIALVLALALLGAPAVALSTCWSSSDVTLHGCGTDCPMMAQMSSRHGSDTMQAVAKGTPCCDISSGKPNRNIQLQVPSDSSRTVVAPPRSSRAFAAALVPAGSDSPRSIPPLPAASPQAVLCTFLI
jgi:hypothetical protein